MTNTKTPTKKPLPVAAQPSTHKVASDQTADRSRIVPLNDKQRDYAAALRSASCIICIGKLGTSKTFLAAAFAGDLLYDKKIKKIIIARPAQGPGKSVGFFKGTKDDKLSGWCSPVTETIRKRVGVLNYTLFMDNGSIELLAIEQCKGRSWDNAIIIVDEAEDMDIPTAKSLVTRQGKNSLTVITGDVAQQHLKVYSGLQYLLDTLPFHANPPVVIDFDHWDYNVRGEESRDWGMAFEKYDAYLAGKK